MKNKIIEVFDGIEINSCKDIGDSIEPFWPKEDADFFTLYLHQIKGGVLAFLDFPTYEEAMEVAKVISKAKKWDIIDNVEKGCSNGSN
jgi:hypothetical protein